jgi:SAM-dependent methyltransferase
MISACLHSKGLEYVVAQWDALASTRRAQIESGEDITYRSFLVPQVVDLLGEIEHQDILDAGCGIGFLTGLLAGKGASVTGIDPSSASIKLARERHPGVQFSSMSLEEYAANTSQKYDMLIANMVLMDVLNLDAFLIAASRVLKTRGRLVFSITHPWFWPRYAAYEMAPWFDYQETLTIEAPFSITNEPGGPPSTHVHRPLAAYINSISKAGFRIVDFREPMPNLETAILYTKEWGFPRYLFGALEFDGTAQLATADPLSSSKDPGK